MCQGNLDKYILYKFLNSLTEIELDFWVLIGISFLLQSALAYKINKIERKLFSENKPTLQSRKSAENFS